ncbi:MAG TPA: hypothetical protein VNS88_09395 [Nitrospiraceae bacterium]|nr:hypothetical protein [Nitrospiraceae bacterium]
MVIVECDYLEDHTHEYPDDWFFGGPRGMDPRADPRWVLVTYEYIDNRLDVIHMTQTPICEQQAIDEFTKVAAFGPGFNPIWITKRQGDEQPHTLKVIYNKLTDEVSDCE